MFCKKLLFEFLRWLHKPILTKPIDQFYAASPRKKLIIKLLLNLIRFGPLGASIQVIEGSF